MDLSGFAGSQVILTDVYFDVCQAGEPMKDYDATKSQKKKCYKSTIVKFSSSHLKTDKHN